MASVGFVRGSDYSDPELLRDVLEFCLEEGLNKCKFVFFDKQILNDELLKQDTGKGVQKIKQLYFVEVKLNEKIIDLLTKVPGAWGFSNAEVYRKPLLEVKHKEPMVLDLSDKSVRETLGKQPLHLAITNASGFVLCQVKSKDMIELKKFFKAKARKFEVKVPCKEVPQVFEFHFY